MNQTKKSRQKNNNFIASSQGVKWDTINQRCPISPHINGYLVLIKAKRNLMGFIHLVVNSCISHFSFII